MLSVYRWFAFMHIFLYRILQLISSCLHEEIEETFALEFISNIWLSALLFCTFSF